MQSGNADEGGYFLNTIETIENLDNEDLILPNIEDNLTENDIPILDTSPRNNLIEIAEVQFNNSSNTGKKAVYKKSASKQKTKDEIDDFNSPEINIFGTAEEGETLFANIDSDVKNVQYQWQVSDNLEEGYSDIEGANLDNYDINSNDEHSGKTIRLEVTYTDKDNVEQVVRSDSTFSIVSFNESLSSNINKYLLNNIKNEYVTLDDANSSVGNQSGLLIAQESFLSSGLLKTESYSSIDTSALENNTLESSNIYFEDSVNLFLIENNFVVAPPVAIFGVAQESSVLTANINLSLLDINLEDIQYQWQISDELGGPYADIEGASSSSYGIASDGNQNGRHIRLTIQYVDSLDVEQIRISSPTNSIININDDPIAIGLIPDQLYEEDALISNIDVSRFFSDEDVDDVLIYSSNNLPPGLSISPIGIISGSPNNDAVGVTRVIITATDQAGVAATQAFNISVNNVNDRPEIDNIEVASLVYNENGSTIVSSNIRLNDVDNSTAEGASITISGGFVNGEDVLSVLPNSLPSGISGSYDAGAGVYTLSGTADLSDYQAALRLITYSNSSENPSTITRTISFVVNDEEESSLPVSRNITVNSLNDAPEISNIESSNISYDENDAAAIISSNLRIGDVDDSNIETLLIFISSNFVSGEDELSISGSLPFGINGSYNSSSGVYSLQGNASLADYELALRQISYSNNSEDPSESVRTVSFIVNDGNINSAIASRNIEVNSVNDAPESGRGYSNTKLHRK